MGMAASQARYLALTARKTNVEYEGQQINQSRLMLSNQSANLFNQMLSMKVPTAPSSTDFTTLQYSFSDGINDSVLENYYQLGKANEEYNYVVTSYHYEDIYTGSRKLMTDPQIQAVKIDKYTYNPTNDKQDLTVKSIKTPSQTGDNSYLITVANGTVYKFTPVDNTSTMDRKVLNAIFGNDMVAESFVYDDANDKYTYDTTEYKRVDLDDETRVEALSQVYGSGYDSTDSYYTDGDGNYVKGSDINNPPESGIIKENNADTAYYTDGSYNYIKTIDLEKLTVKSDFSIYTAEYTPDIVGYTAIGNSTLTEVSSDDYKSDKTISTEIEQIIKDMQGPNGNQSSAENFAKCFDAEGNYIGGIYSFKLAGVTYYATKDDLYKTTMSGISSEIADNGIDGQQSKLAYYNATYLSTKVYETKKALLETDGMGRFSTIKFEDDSVVYTLNAETITDDAAYEDAMNKYYYEQEVYDKRIADINARTEIIQAQDRQLELRLEQLNTEQSALQNEMEAVKKVVDKHAEQGFKTFGS